MAKRRCTVCVRGMEGRREARKTELVRNVPPLLSPSQSETKGSNLAKQSSCRNPVIQAGGA